MHNAHVAYNGPLTLVRIEPIPLVRASLDASFAAFVFSFIMYMIHTCEYLRVPWMSRDNAV